MPTLPKQTQFITYADDIIITESHSTHTISCLILKSRRLKNPYSKSSSWLIDGSRFVGKLSACATFVRYLEEQYGNIWGLFIKIPY